MNADLPDCSRGQAVPRFTRELVARSFGMAADSYDSCAKLQREVADILLGEIPDPGIAPVILDVGCGTGYCSQQLARRFPAAAVLALDLAEPMLQSARALLHDRSTLICGDAQHLPLASAAMDLVVSSLTLQWCSETGRVFDELFRVLKPGGNALVSTFGPMSLYELKRAFSTVDRAVHVNDFIGLEAVVALATAAGFSCTATSATHYRHYPSLLALARELKGIGAHNINEGRPAGLMGRKRFAKAEAAFQIHIENGRGVPVTYEILYLHLHKPEQE